MTIATTAAVSTLEGNGSTTVFSYNFIIPYESDGVTPAANVYYTDLNGVRTLLATNTYSISGVGNAAGGTVTYNPGGAIATGTFLSVVRTIPYTQPLSFPNQGFFPETVEEGLDLLEEQLQQIVAVQSYTIRAPITDFVAPAELPSTAIRASKYLFFDAQGNPSVAAGIPTTAVIGASTKLIFVSAQSSLANADALAAATGGTLVVDINVTLGASTTLLSHQIFFAGGIITLGNFDLTFGSSSGLFGCAIVAGAIQLFAQTGTGRVKGNIRGLGVFAEWWGAISDNSVTTVNTAAFQSAGDYVIQTNGASQKVFGFGQYYYFSSALSFTSASRLPMFVGSGITPDSTNWVFAPSVNTTLLTLNGGSAAPGNGGIIDVYISANAHTTGVTLNNAGFNTIRIGWSALNAGPVALLSSAGGFAEGNSITIVGGLLHTASAVTFTVSGGTGSFATTKIEPETNITLGSGSRAGVGVYAINSGAFWYNGSCSGTVLNSGASNIYLFNKVGNTPPCYLSGNQKLEGSDSNPIGICDPAGGVVYYAGTITVQGTNLTDYSNVRFPKIMSYGSGGVIDTLSAGSYGQVLAQAGSSTFNFGGGGIGQTFVTFYIEVTATNYDWDIIVDFPKNAPNGALTSRRSTLVLDSGSIGAPTFAISGGALTMVIPGSPAGMFTASYSVIAP